MKVKIFCEFDDIVMEKRVNEWLENNNIDIVYTGQVADSDTLTLILFYKETSKYADK
jgi:hypothetical protein